MDIFDALAEHAALSFDDARMLPVEAYTSEQVLAREIDRLFGRGWLCAGRTADIPNAGDYLTTELPTPGESARSVLVVRGDDGIVRAFDNVCIHRGAQLVEGCGTEARLTCPYHAWVYRLDGSLIGAPHLSLDPSGYQLAELRTEVWEGFVFVNQDPAASPLAPRLAGLHDVVARYGICLLYTSPSPRDGLLSRMPSSA